MLRCLTVSLVSVWGYWSPSPRTWLSHAPSTMAPLTSRKPFLRPCVSNLGLGTPSLVWMQPRGSSSRSLLLTHLTSSHMPGSWTPPGLNQPCVNGFDSDVGFHVIKRVARTRIHNFRGSITSRHLRHSSLRDSLYTLRKNRHRAFRNTG